MENSEWLANGGAYLLLGLVWIGSAVFYAVLGLQTGKSVRAENDGCLMAIANVVMAFVGGAIGYLAMMRFFPAFVVTSMAGAMILPGISTWYFRRNAR